MDLYCSKCGEPWEFDSLHEEAQARYGIPYHLPNPDPFYAGPKEKNPEYDEDAYQRVYKVVSSEFRSKGCVALNTAFSTSECAPEGDNAERDRTFGLTRSEAAGALYDILGDDMDGAAAMLEDMGF